MRFARGKGTHQRVASDGTSWSALKATPAKSSKNKRQFKGGNKNGQFSGGKRNQFRGRQDEDANSNFTPLGERPNNKPKAEAGENGSGERNTKGFGKSKLVKIFGQFWVPPEDGKRLLDLQKKLKAEGLSKKEILDALQNERRRAEKAGKRRRDKTCFQCRQFGHVLSDCPTLCTLPKDPTDQTNLVDTANMGEICFKCGSTEHTSRRCKKSGDKFSFASCFVCKATGHIARQCPDNTKGIYPSGGSCGDCGAVTHLRKDCPTRISEGGSPDPSAIASRVANPFTSTEYEAVDVPVVAKTTAKVSNKKRKNVEEAFEEEEIQIPQTNTVKPKKRKIKF